MNKADDVSATGVEVERLTLVRFSTASGPHGCSDTSPLRAQKRKRTPCQAWAPRQRKDGRGWFWPAARPLKDSRISCLVVMLATSFAHGNVNTRKQGEARLAVT